MKNNLKFFGTAMLLSFLFVTSGYGQNKNSLYIYPESITYLDKIDSGDCEARLSIIAIQYDAINEDRKSFGTHAYKKNGVSMLKGATHGYNEVNGNLGEIERAWEIKLEFRVWEEDTGEDLSFNTINCLNCDDDGGTATAYLSASPKTRSDIIVTKGDRFEVKWRYEIK